MNLKKKEKQNRDFATIYAAKYGVKMDLGYTQLSRGERAIVCLIKGILIFLCVFGSAGNEVGVVPLYSCHLYGDGDVLL